MKEFFFAFLAFLFIMTIAACKQPSGQPIVIEEVAPWCIKGFDVLDRSPEERISLLKELGFKKYGYNRGNGNFAEMIEEFDLARQNDIEVSSVFLWLNASKDSIGNLSDANQELLDNLGEVEQKPAIWLSMSNNYFEDLSNEESVALAVEMVEYIKSISDELACDLAIYNHHGWFGNPYRQIDILRALKHESISMVYNFHHAHEYVEDFSEIAPMIVPHLSFVNLNGVKKEGPQILPLGSGDYELGMIKALMDEGYDGPWGILGHIKTEDVKVVLERNIEGLSLLNSQIEMN